MSAADDAFFEARDDLILHQRQCVHCRSVDHGGGDIGKMCIDGQRLRYAYALARAKFKANQEGAQ